MKAEELAALRKLNDERTKGAWSWQIHDHSMASLGVSDSPGYGTPLVLSASPCEACAGRAEPKEWKWGRCCTPSLEDAEFIPAIANAADRLLAEAEENARLRALLCKAGEALGPFGALQDAMDNGHNLVTPIKDIADDAVVYGFNLVVITHGNLRTARSVSQEIKEALGE